MKYHTLSQLEEMYKKLPSELREAMFSDDVGLDVESACKKNGIEDEDKIREVAKYVGYVLLGILPPSEFKDALITEMQLSADVAKNIADDFDRVIFYPLRESLAALYPEETPSNVGPPKIMRRTKSAMQKKADKYRESIE